MMPMSMFADMTSPETQLSPNPRKRKANHAPSSSIACSQAEGQVSPCLESLHPTIVPQRSPKRVRLQKVSPASHHGSKTNTSPRYDNISAKPIAALLLRPCHVCWRRPTTRAVLDGYADCDECGARTCYICLRVCEDMNCKLRIIDIHEDALSGKSELRSEEFTEKGKRRQIGRAHV